MEIDYKEFEKSIANEIKSRQEKISTLYKTLEEIEEYGYTITFLASTQEETIKSAFSAGRAIGELEGEIDALRWFGTVLYDEYTKNKK